MFCFAAHFNQTILLNICGNINIKNTIKAKIGVAI